VAKNHFLGNTTVVSNAWPKTSLGLKNLSVSSEPALNAAGRFWLSVDLTEFALSARSKTEKSASSDKKARPNRNG